MKVLFITNLPSPYRVDFFNALGKYCDLTVCYERHTATNRNKLWRGKEALHFREIYADGRPIGIDQSMGLGVTRVIRKESFDHLILSGYASPSVMLAIAYCRCKKIPYSIESDGAFFTRDALPKRILKKYLLCGAERHFTTCEEHIRYLCSLGIPRERICKYPFTSMTEEDMQAAKVLSRAEKAELRSKFGMKESKIVLSVGRFSSERGYGKGYDTLMQATRALSEVGVYIVGDAPTEEFLQMREEMGATHVHFVGFQEKQALQNYYAAADVFVLLTREDIWGLVINEAMMHGLPVITTTRCNAGLEMVKEGENGYLVAPGDHETVAKRLSELTASDADLTALSAKSRSIAEQYTIEKMARAHAQALHLQ